MTLKRQAAAATRSTRHSISDSRRLTVTQRAVMRLLHAAAPAPLSGAAISARLGIPEGVLGITLRSLQRAGLIVASQGRQPGWVLAEQRTAGTMARAFLDRIGRRQVR